MKKQCLIFCFVLLLVPALAYPQAGQTGSITGVVRTPDGDPLAGVVVLLKGPALIIPEIEAVSNRAGVYSFFALSPGIYDLSFIVRGWEGIVRKGIAISAGDVVTLDINLKPEAPADEVAVEAKNPNLPRPRSIGVEKVDDKFFPIAPEERMMDFSGLKIEHSILFASISFIIKSLPLFSFSGL